MLGSRPSSVAVLSEFNAVELALLVKGLRSASLSRVGVNRKPHILPLLLLLLLPLLLSLLLLIIPHMKTKSTHLLPREREDGLVSGVHSEVCILQRVPRIRQGEPDKQAQVQAKPVEIRNTIYQQNNEIKCSTTLGIN